MRCKPVLGRTSLAAVTGALILAASPAAFAQANQTQSNPNQANPNQAYPSQTAPSQTPDQMPSNQAFPSQPMTTPVSPMTQERSGQVPAERMSARAANRVADPKTTLASSTVDDKDGQAVGQVQSVGTSRSGHANRITVALTNSATPGKVVVLRASRLTYDPNNNSLQSSLTAREIERQPSIQTP